MRLDPAVLALAILGLVPTHRGRAATPPPLPPAAAADDGALLQGYLPKEDLGVLDFLKEHPGADGRGIIVAILDTGVDLAHEALARTSTGGPKILDVFDATDNGFLPLPVEAATGNAPMRGLSGRLLRLTPDLPAGTPVRLGLIAGPEFFPEGLTARRTAERRDAWRRARETWEGGEGAAGKDGAHGEAIREALDAILEMGKDPGDRYDVAALRRGDSWEVRIDTDADGDLAEERPLHPYREARDVASFPNPEHFSVALERISPDGSSLFLFFDEGGHGTHVAGIVGGFYGPGDPLNGLAPGVAFLAAKVGNGRFGGSTSHNSIIKAAQWAVDHGADVINVSFGGDSFFDEGREATSTFLDELVERTGVVICASAGNEGPALSTVGSPGSARRIFGWGAAISKKTQETNYGALDPRRDDLFDFSSRGPLMNGDPGVDWIAPGAALSTLPTWGLVKGESWNGTSMASPQGAGFCALVLSACREKGVPVTPARLRRAMREGARVLCGLPVIEQGDGMPQALRTLEALQGLAAAYPSRACSTRTPRDLDARSPVVDWVVTVHNATGTGGGYYERDVRAREPYRISFRVRPDFPFDSLQSERADFLKIVRLSSDAPWLRPPLSESLHSGGGTVVAQIDPSRLAAGLNVGRIIARDIAHPEAGIEFALVATVIRPEDVDPRRPILEGTWDLERGDRRDLFVRVPAGATRARLRVRETLADPANAYEIALAAPDLLRRPGDRVATRRFRLAAGQEATIDLGTAPGGGVLEAVAFSRWHDNRPGRLEWRIELAGVDLAAEPPITIPPERPGAGFVLGAPPWGADVRFDASLDRVEEPLDVSWNLRGDSLAPQALNGLPAMLEEGRALLVATAGEDVEIDLRVGPEFEDFLDDAFFRVHDDSGREAAHGYLYEGRCAFHAPHAAVYRIEFSIWARGTRFFDESAVVSPVVLRRSGPHALAVHRDAVDGFIDGPDSLDAVSLIAGERRRYFLRAENLPDGRVFHGSLRVLGSDGVELAHAPVIADTRPLLPPAPGEGLSASVEAAVRRARLLAGRSDATDASRRSALDALALCERLRIASPLSPAEERVRRSDVGSSGKGGRGSKRASDGDEKGEALPQNELWEIREARVRLLLAANDLDPLDEALDALRESLPPAKEVEPAGVAERRAKESILGEMEAERSYRKGDTAGARRRLDVARGLDADVAGGSRLDALLLFAEGKDEEARGRAERWLAGRPDDLEVDRVLVGSEVRLGWWDLAALRLAEWPVLHPAAAAEARSLWEQVDAARRQAPLPGTPLLSVGPWMP